MENFEKKYEAYKKKFYDDIYKEKEMSYYRSYFEKNNTIIKNTQINTAKNPTTEIFYGSGFSKFLFKVDFTDWSTKLLI